MGEAGGRDAVYPAAASALERGRRRRRAPLRLRHRTVPVTFAEIKEVDEEASGDCGDCGAADERRRRPDLLDEHFSAQMAASRRRRVRRELLREPDEAPPAPLAPRAASEPRPGAEPS